MEQLKASDIVLSGALILDDDNKLMIVNTLQLKDYCELKESPDLYDPIMNFLQTVGEELGYEVQVVSETGG